MAKEKFEDALEKLEGIVRKMESGDLPLEESLKSFEEGMKLIRFCTIRLDEAQRRILQIMGKEDNLSVKNFSGENVD